MSRLSPSATVRYQARETLKGNYVAAVFAFVILLLPVFAVIGLESIIEAVLVNLKLSEEQFEVMKIVLITPVIIVAVVFSSPILTGFIRAFYQSALTRKINISDVFLYYSRYRFQKTLLLNVSLMIRLLLPAVICGLPLFIYYYLCYTYMVSFVGTTVFLDFAFILTVLSSILLALYSLRYFLVFILYFENEQAEIPELFRCSKRMMKAHGHEATSLIFSFAPWLLLCLTVLPILYVAPYMTQSLCIGAKWMLRAEAENERIRI